MTGTFLTTSRDVLMQKDTNGDLHPCTYFSKIFAPAKQNYDIYNQELLAIIHALTKWCQYLTSTTHPVTTLTDHKNLLTYFNKPQCLSHQQAHWQMFLQDYDLIWDPLTPSLKKTLDIFSDNILQVLLPDLQINMLDTTLASKIAKSTPSNHLSSMPWLPWKQTLFHFHVLLKTTGTLIRAPSITAPASISLNPHAMPWSKISMNPLWHPW